jgi:hypothetical protein
MTTKEKYRYYIFAFLAFCVASSKHIIIYNEETLVACSFFLFVFFVARSFGKTVTESLNERGESIQAELQNFLQLKHQSLEQAKTLHQRVSQVGTLVSQLEASTVHQLANWQRGGAQAVRGDVIAHMEHKLKTLSMSGYAIQNTLQQVLADHVRTGVLYTFAQYQRKRTSPDAVGTRTIQRALALLQKSGPVSA